MLGINEKLRQHWHSLSAEEKAAYKTSQGSSTSTPSEATPSPSTATATATQSSSTSSQLLRGQTTIHLCQQCGRMFFTEETLETHKRVEHAIVVPEAAVVDRDEGESNATETETNVTEADQLEPNGEPNDDSVPARDEVKYFNNKFA